jgi:hypothetical protein
VIHPLDVPPVNGPRDLPALRRWIMRHYRPDGVLGFANESKFIMHAMPSAPLWWVEGEACDLLAESAPTLPADYVLTRADVPSDTGMVVFEHDLIGTDSYPSAEGREVRISGVLWSFGRLPDMAGEQRFGMSFMLFTKMDLGDESHDMYQLWKMLFPPELLHGPIWAFIGRTDWVFGWELEQVIPDNPHGFDAIANASFAEDRRLMLGLWKLATTPIVNNDLHPLPRHMRRQAEREQVNPEVRVITMHGPSAGEPPESGSSGARQYRHRWVVRPHWVNQPYGPGRTERRLILRGPFTKGPEGAPLIGGERVWRIQAPKPDERN